MSRTTYKSAAVQASPIFVNLGKSIDKAISLIEEAASRGAALIGFPETFSPGYPWWIWLDAPAWGMQFVQRYFENSLVVGSTEAKQVRKFT
jgi:nitrilase